MTTIPLVQAPTCSTEAKPAVAETTVGNYFVANYPPFGFWTKDGVSDFRAALDRPPVPGVELGVYAHIPFCRKRCHFCYFRVYTDKNARDIRGYIDAMVSELSAYASRPVIGGRKPKFVYFGGGTPSYLSAEQLRELSTSMRRVLPWDEAEEVTLEAEPGTLNEGKVRAIRGLGVTRLSLGIEHFDDYVLETNGRAHRSKEALRAFGWARDAGFDSINVDLIAGMVEETDERWAETIAKTLALGPDSVTMYQMEVPYNTTIYQRMKAEGALVAPVADWATKRRWVAEAFAAFEKAGYTVTSATTVTKNADRTRFLYRKGLFDGTDLLSVGVSSFGHVSGVNYQNEHNFEPYLESVGAGRLPTYRAYALGADELYVREFALQMKNGSVDAGAFARKFGRTPWERFGPVLAGWRDRGLLVEGGGRIGVTREGLLQVDRLIYELFRPEHQTGRYA